MTKWAMLGVMLFLGVAQAEPKIEVRFAPELLKKLKTPARIVVAVNEGRASPKFDNVGPPGTRTFGTTIDKVPEDGVVLIDDRSVAFPLTNKLSTLPVTKYNFRAVCFQNPDVNLAYTSGNFISSTTPIDWDGQKATVTLSEVVKDNDQQAPKGREFLKIPSAKLTAFHGREMFTRVGVVLPKDFDPNGTDKPYGLMVHIGGFGQRYNSVVGIPADSRFVQIQLDGAGPLGDPYAIDSANNGPYGAALVEELIPFIEKKFRCRGTPDSRFTTGGSTGGWVSLALQVFYPDVFNGCWSQCPDGVDFRAFQLIDIYSDKNAYVNRHGFERPAMRNINGDTVYTTRHEVQMERVLGGGRWELSGQQWASWNAVYGPKGKDGPVPLWDNETGAINKDVLEHWKKYDLRMILEKDWAKLGPKLQGKMHIWVGDADDYFLNNGVHYLKGFLAQAKNPTWEGTIEIAPRKGHTSGWSQDKILEDAAKRMR
ncbi:MAG: alpha/beta hydrolase-fold protein [Fimbriiglobus sp.]